jgi:hypothetical protein
VEKTKTFPVAAGAAEAGVVPAIVAKVATVMAQAARIFFTEPPWGFGCFPKLAMPADSDRIGERTLPDWVGDAGE